MVRPGEIRIEATMTAILLRTTVVVTDHVTLDAGNSILLYICLATGHGESQKWDSLFGGMFLNLIKNGGSVSIGSKKMS